MGLLSSKLPDKKMMTVCRQMATSYNAGIPILRTLELMTDKERDKKTREVLLTIHDDISNGSTLEQAARRQAEYLPPLFVELLASGETGGRLDAMLKDLANYFEDRTEMRRMIVRKSMYPCFQLMMAWFLGTFALRILGHIGSGTFSIGGYLADYANFQAKAMLLFATAAMAVIALWRMGLISGVWGWIATYLWPLRSITRRFARARFFRSLSLLVGSGVPIQHAITRATTTMLNAVMERDLLTAVPRVMSGLTLAEAFAPCNSLTPETKEMIVVGEQSGQLEEMLRKTSQYQMDEAVHAVSIATRVGEVLVMVGVAIVIGYVVISFWSGFYGGMMDDLGI
ncbi:MAG: hypothetical protein GWP08_13255 [Nitrospiraceae bacterium]|nr:hypothetical protein [Nitrospiraceae bacterium]